MSDVFLVDPQGRPVATRERLAARTNGDDPAGWRSSANARTDATFGLPLGLLRQSLAGRSGLMFDSTRDIWKTAGYKKKLTEEDFFDLYDRNAVAGRMVDQPVRTTWRDFPEIVEVDENGDEVSEETSEFAKAARAILKQIEAPNRFERVDRLAGIGEYAVLLIGSTKSKGDLDRPLSDDGALGVEDIGFVTPFRQNRARIESLVDDDSDPRFGQPAMYSVALFDDFSKSQRRSIQARRVSRLELSTGRVPVHWSRVVHVVEDPLESNVYGRPRLRRSFNTLQDMMKIVASSSEAWWRLVGGWLLGRLDPKTPIPEKTSDGKDPLEELQKQVLEADHGIRRFVGASGLDLEHVGGSPADPSGIWMMIKQLLATSADMPERILFGSERGELASSQDERQWEGQVEERREKHATPTIVRQFIDRMIELRVLPPPRAGVDFYEVHWRPLRQLSELEEADLAKKRGEAAQALGEAQLTGVQISDGEVRRMINLPEEVPGDIELPGPGEDEEELDEEIAARDAAEIVAAAAAVA